ncbi:hypothetical protein M0804_007610 [Polistes exclamans]|nr:hypothetical protein M0804_007610 [Polistes exclamans]
MQEDTSLFPREYPKAHVNLSEHVRYTHGSSNGSSSGGSGGVVMVMVVLVLLDNLKIGWLLTVPTEEEQVFSKQVVAPGAGHE